MFRAARWRSEKNKIKAMFKLQFKATQVPGKGWEAVMVTLVPVDIGKPSLRSEKIAVVNGECRWLNPMYETVKLTQDQKTGKISDKVYQFIVSATGQAKTGVLGEINVNLAEYAEVYKPTSVSLPLQDSNNGAILHVTIQRVQNDAQGREAVENGETPKEGNENKGNFAKSPRITLKSQLSNPENEEGGKADTGTNDINAAEEGSFINSKALVKFHSSRNMPSHGDSSGDLRKSSSFDGVSASGSESSSGQYTPKENGIKKCTVHQENASVLSPLSNSDTPQNTDWSVSIELDRSIAGSTNSSGETGLRERVLGSDNTLEKQKCDFDDLARQLEVSELELQTLRKQVMKESRRGQDLSRELSSVMEERDTLRKEYDKLKASNKRADDDENASAILQFGTKNPWSMLQEMKEELDHEKNLNANLRLQLQKTQESNSELIFAVRDLEELLDQKKSEICCNQDSQGTECQKQLSQLRNSEDKQELLETTSDNEEEQCELDILVKEHDNIKVAYSQEQRILDLTSELELYKKDREDLEMQLEQLALDYEILKQENHDISSRLEQIQLREQLRMQYECSKSHPPVLLPSPPPNQHLRSMDREPEELQFLGLPGILTSSATLIAGYRHRRLFGQITAALILPLSLLFLLHIHISHVLFSRIHADERALDRAPPDSPSESRLINLLSSEWSLFLLFKAVYLLFLLIFALLSTSAVVYTVACIFTAKEVTFAKLFTVIPKVWKRLMLTFLWAFLFLLGYNLSSAVAIVCLILLAGQSAVGVALVVALVSLYILGLVWISVVWHLASVVSVLEDACGLSAMKKSRSLIKGKGRVACGIFALLNLAFIGIELGFKILVVKGRVALGLGFGGRFGCGLLFAVMLMGVVLLGLVAQTVVYFVCKSYHHESIDKSSLADHLEVYLGEYVPLKGRDVQMEQYYA